MKKKGGDILSLNINGSTNKNTNAGQDQSNRPTSPPITKLFPSPPSSASAATKPDIMFPLVDLVQDIDNQIKLPTLNGQTQISDTVTVTHFSEKRGTMEKISVPSRNIVNAEFRGEPNRVVATTTTTIIPNSSTNPFLNTTPPTITTSTTNPFHDAVNSTLATTITTAIETELAASLNNNTKMIDDILNSSENGVITTTTATTTLATPIDLTTRPTNPFTVTNDIKIDDDNNHEVYGCEVNITDAFKNYKNNNSSVKTQSLLDENNKNMNNIEVNSFFFLKINVIIQKKIHFHLLCRLLCKYENSYFCHTHESFVLTLMSLQKEQILKIV